MQAPLRFIELYNRADVAIDVEGWRIAGDVRITFKAGTTIPPQETLLAVPYDPRFGTQDDVFRSVMDVDPSTETIGRFTGRFDDDRGVVRLERPDEPPIEQPTVIPYLTIDEVAYLTESPWPADANGTGDSLTRISETVLGTVPTNWTARPPSAGSVDYQAIPVDGDFDDDGDHDCGDIDALIGEIAADTSAAAFDLTGDGFVNLADRDAWLAEAGAVNLASSASHPLGDATLDGRVNVADLNALGVNWLSPSYGVIRPQ